MLEYVLGLGLFLFGIWVGSEVNGYDGGLCGREGCYAPTVKEHAECRRHRHEER